jgi:hypothetical protein
LVYLVAVKNLKLQNIGRFIIKLKNKKDRLENKDRKDDF